MEEKKICKKCNLIKGIDNFYWRKDSKKYRNECFDCFHKVSQRISKKEKYPIINNEKQCSKCFKNRNIELFEFRKNNNKYRTYCKICDNFNRNKNKNFSYNEYENKFLEKIEYSSVNMKKCSKCLKTDIKNMFNGTLCNNCAKLLQREKREKITHKKCNKCNEIKEICNFGKNELSTRLSFKRLCNDCHIINKKNKYKYYKKWIVENKDKIKLSQKKYYINNKNYILKKSKEYRLNNLEREKKRAARYRLDNKEKIKKKRREQVKLKRLTNLEFRIYQNISRRIRECIFKNGQKWISALEYSIIDLKNHLMNHPEKESWMTWGNYGKYDSKTWNDQDPTTWTWQIDHIIPHSLFKYKSINDDNFKKCWSLDNLRPYPSKKNFLDGISRIRHNNVIDI